MQHEDLAEQSESVPTQASSRRAIVADEAAIELAQLAVILVHAKQACITLGLFWCELTAASMLIGPVFCDGAEFPRRAALEKRAP